MAITKILCALLLLLISKAQPASTAIPNETIQEVSDTLFNNGYNAMALTLRFGPTSILSSSYFTLTIFAPQDSAFKLTGQPSLSLLSYHFSPLYIPFSTFRNFPYGTPIPSAFPNSSLLVTSSASTSLNGVPISPALYDDGFVAVYGVQRFLSQDFRLPDVKPNRDFGCSRPKSGHAEHHPFARACEVLRSRGYSIIASILEMQLGGFQNQTPSHALTIFAPSDRAFSPFRNRRNLRPVFFRHVVPCRLSMHALNHLNDGMLLSTYLDGFFLNTTKTKNGRTIDGVSLAEPDLYTDNWLIVHGIKDVIRSNEESKSRTSSSSPQASSKLIFLIFFLAIFI